MPYLEGLSACGKSTLLRKLSKKYPTINNDFGDICATFPTFREKFREPVLDLIYQQRIKPAPGGISDRGVLSNILYRFIFDELIFNYENNTEGTENYKKLDLTLNTKEKIILMVDHCPKMCNDTFLLMGNIKKVVERTIKRGGIEVQPNFFPFDITKYGLEKVITTYIALSKMVFFFTFNQYTNAKNLFYYDVDYSGFENLETYVCERLEKNFAIKGTSNSAGFDIFLEENVILSEEDSMLSIIPPQFQIPKNHFGMITTRSSGYKKGIVCNIGIIDSDYKGKIKVLAHSRRGNINLDSKISYFQLLIINVAEKEDISFIAKRGIRGEGGFGSSDKD